MPGARERLQIVTRARFEPSRVAHPIYMNNWMLPNAASLLTRSMRF